MSQTVITAAFEEWKAQEAAGGNRVVLDGFVLANVPGLDPDIPISNTEDMPPDSQIVYRQDVDKCGVVNNNAVVYSITMGSNIGTFDFNWIGLVNKASGVLAMIVHTPMQRKLKTEDGQQGNAINRSFLMEYDGAATETQINTPAQTWQIDFTARLSGMDEEWRLANFDIYGPGAFFGDGFLVKKDGSKYQVQPGNGYIGGIRAILSASEEITVTSLPAKVFADVSWQGALTGRWQSVTAMKASTAGLTDYIDGDGFAHYVFAVASIDAAGAVTDLRPIGSIPAQVADGAVKSVNHHKPNQETGDVELTAVDTGALPLDKTALAVDLNTLGANASAGVYFQTMNVNATAANHYPMNEAGTLLVTISAYGCQQEYTTYSSRRKFVRGLTGPWNGKDGPWSEWGEYLPTSGGKIVGLTTFTINGECIRLKNDSATMSAYLAWYDNDNTRLGLFGRGGAGNGMSWTNQAAGSLINLPADGSVTINTKGNAGNITLNGIAHASCFKATQRPGAGSYASQFTQLAPFYHEFSDAGPSVYNPIIKQKHVDGGHMWSAGMLVSPENFVFQYIKSDGTNSTIQFHPSGQIIPGSYVNFDQRYLTKSENLPVGIPLPWPTATPPSGWLICNGSAFNKATCPQLAAVYPGGYLPDLRAQFIRGLDNGKNIDTGRAILSTQAGQSPYSSVGSTYGNTSWNSRATVKTGYYMTTGTDNDGTYQIMSESQAQRETRPTNVAFNYIVRAA